MEPDMAPTPSIGIDTVNYAGFWWRFLAVFIDSLIIQVISCVLVIGLALLLVLGTFAVGNGDYTLIEAVLKDEGIFKTITDILATVLVAIIAWLYYALFESSHLQATPGKLVCQMKVTDTAGNRISFLRATGRYWASWISKMLCGAGYIMAAFTIRKQALHDKLAGTVVIKGA